MKKILIILSAISITTYSSTVVFACGPNRNYGEDNFSPEEQISIKQEFLAEIESIVQTYVSGTNISSALVKSENGSSENVFLCFDQISELMDFNAENDDVQTFDLKKIQKYDDMKVDLNQTMRIKSELSKVIQEQIAEQTRYSFLLNGIDTILVDFHILDEIEIKRQSLGNIGGEDLIYTIDFSLQFEINYKFNGILEPHFTKNIPLKFLLISSDAITESIRMLISTLPIDMYEKYEGFLDFNESDLEVIDSIFLEQTGSVLNYFKNEVKFNNLKDNVDKIIDQYNALDTLKIEKLSFDSLFANVIDAQFEKKFSGTVYPRDDGFMEKSMLMKSDNLTNDELELAFNREIAFASNYFDTSAFVEGAIKNIDANLGIKKESDAEFIESGRLILENVEIEILGTQIKINSIGFLYTYNPEVKFWQQLDKAFKNWQEIFGIYPSTDRYALFKFSDKTEIGTKFWNHIDNVSDIFAKQNILSSIDEKYFDDVKKGTGFSNFYIYDWFHIDTYTRPSIKIETNGIIMDYGDWNKATNAKRQSAYSFYVRIDSVLLNLKVTAIENYKNNFFDSLNSRKYIIER